MENPITSETYMDLLVENELVGLYPNMPVTYINNKFSMVHIKEEQFNPCVLGQYHYHSFPSCFTIESAVDLEESGVTKIQRNANFELFGSGTLIGIVDTGIDYTHEMFRYPGRTTRIVTLWDQCVEDEDRQPEEYGYGAVYTREDINAAIQSENPLEVVPSVDYGGHGTVIAGIAGGSENAAEGSQGVAPMAEFVIVKCKPAKKHNRDIFVIGEDQICFQETDLLLGVRFLVEMAERLQKPMAICLAIGTGQGGHDGQGALSSYLSFISQMPRICVTLSAGNEGVSRRHYYGEMAAQESYRDVEMKIGEENGFALEVWQHSPNRISIEIFSPTGEHIPQILPRIDECRQYRFIFEKSMVWINNQIVETETGDQMILVRFETPQEGVWKFRIGNVDHAALAFHMWLQAGGFVSDGTHFLESNPDTTITSPGNATLPIIVTAYDSRSGGIYERASRGYTRSQVIKPDFAAPGVNIFCPIRGNAYASATGTGIAAAFTTGMVAMILEWAIVQGKYRTINGNDIRKLMIRGTVQDFNMPTPNHIWGYGKVNLFEFFEKLR